MSNLLTRLFRRDNINNFAADFIDAFRAAGVTDELVWDRNEATIRIGDTESFYLGNIWQEWRSQSRAIRQEMMAEFVVDHPAVRFTKPLTLSVSLKGLWQGTVRRPIAVAMDKRRNTATGLERHARRELTRTAMAALGHLIMEEPLSACPALP